MKRYEKFNLLCGGNDTPEVQAMEMLLPQIMTYVETMIEENEMDAFKDCTLPAWWKKEFTARLEWLRGEDTP